jgi:pyrroline-5-carboxylate reductase
VNQRVGFIGTGQFVRLLTAGLARDGAATSVTVSPRNAAKQAAVHGAVVVGSNTAVVDASDLVLVTTRVEHGVGSVQGLPCGTGQTAVNLVGGLALVDLAAAVAPAAEVKAMTSNAAARVPCPFLIYPKNPEAGALGERFGTVHALTDERAFDATAAMPVFFALLLDLPGEGEGCCADQGVAPEIARAHTLAGLRGLTTLVEGLAGGDVDVLIARTATPGRLTEGGLADLKKYDAMAPWCAAMDRILARALGEK